MKRKIVLSVVMIILLFFGFMISMVSMVAIADQDKGNHEEKLYSSVENCEKALVVYQPTISGEMASVAQKIAQGLNDGGYEVTLNYPGEHMPSDITEYAIIVFGTPAYGAHPLSLLTIYMERIVDDSEAKIVLYSVGINEECAELDEMEEYVKNGAVVEKIKFMQGDKSNESVAYDLGLSINEK